MAYTNIDDPSAYFQTTTYTGAGADTEVTNSGNSDLKPDLLWIKNRTAGYAHFVVDSNRNISYAQNSSNAPYLETDSTAAENNNQNWMASVNTNGFTTGISEHINNNSGSAYVAWQWKANGGTTSSNTDGGITTTVQTNTDAGFSIVTYAGTGTSNTIGHGLGVAPDMMIVKNRSEVYNWAVYHKDSNSSPKDFYAQLNTTNAFSLATDIFGTSSATSSVIGVKNFNETNASGSNYVAYCFASKQGYSKFGSYEGNSNANGPFVYTGFKPAFVMLKPADVAEQWIIHDGTRDPFNKTYHYLFANGAEAEAAGGTHHIDLLSNGFKIRTSNANWNASSTVIYMAFAENPFTTSTGVPATAR
jgi:hypothetical protein